MCIYSNVRFTYELQRTRNQCCNSSKFFLCFLRTTKTPVTRRSPFLTPRPFSVFFTIIIQSLRSVIFTIGMGGAPIGAGGTWPPLLEAKGTGGHNLGKIHISHHLISYHAFTLMSTPQTYELGWLSYLSNILSPTGQKVGVKKFCSIPSQNLSPHFQNRGAAPDIGHSQRWQHTAVWRVAVSRYFEWWTDGRFADAVHHFADYLGRCCCCCCCLRCRWLAVLMRPSSALVSDVTC